MIKANELRIGNWIGHKTMPNMKVARISEVSVDLDCPESEADYWDADIMDLVGIPLTDEWLVKAGFEKCTLGYGYKNYLNEKIHVELTDHGADIMYCENLNNQYWIRLCYIAYVHQLQNLYFSLTSNELFFDL